MRLPLAQEEGSGEPEHEPLRFTGKRLPSVSIARLSSPKLVASAWFRSIADTSNCVITSGLAVLVSATIANEGAHCREYCTLAGDVRCVRFFHQVPCRAPQETTQIPPACCATNDESGTSLPERHRDQTDGGPKSKGTTENAVNTTARTTSPSFKQTET